MIDLPLPRVINAAGHLSMLGGGVTPPELASAIAEAVRTVLSQPVDMAALKDEASRRIAEATGAEAGCVTTGAAAGIALSVAACVSNGELDVVGQLPDVTRKPVVLQYSHDINFGAPVVQMIRLGGGNVVVAGSPSRTTAEDIERSLAWAAALVFVKSHHVRPQQSVDLERCISIARDRGIPVIVDAAAEEDLRASITAGANLVIYSGGKALGGLSSSGFVAGKRDLVAAVRAQERGIGRAMKVGPEQLVSVIVSRSLYGSATNDAEAVLASLHEATDAIGGAEFAIVDDEAGRPIRRLEVRTPRAADIVESLRANDPPIYVRAHHTREGRFAIDPRNLSVADGAIVADGLRRAFVQAGVVAGRERGLKND